MRRVLIKGVVSEVEMNLNIEMAKKKVEISMSDGSRLSGHFFVSLHSQGHSRGECLLDLLLDERAYLPFEIDGEEIVLLKKGGIFMIESEGCQYLKMVPFQKKMEIRICFQSGQTLEGKVYSDLPQTKSRLSDFLNHSSRFFCMEVDEKEYLINTQFIKSVYPHLTP